MDASREAPGGPRPETTDESRAIFQAEVEGRPFLVLRDGESRQCLLPLPSDGRGLTIGRNDAADVCLDWDPEVSGLHAELEWVAGEYVLVDDGLSRNGSYANGERVHGRLRLRDGDLLRFGRTVIMFRQPRAMRDATRATPEALTATSLSAQQRKVLIALCRPFKEGRAFATPATNQQIAEELFLTPDTVKLHLRGLFHKFEVADLPQNKKRVTLVRRALDSGLVSDRDL